MTLTITNEDLSQVFCFDATYRTETLVFAGADVLAPGTIMARVTASGKLVPCNPVAIDGTENPVAILDYEVTATGAGDIQARVGIAGKFRVGEILFDGGAAVTAAHLDQLRGVGLIPVVTHNVLGLDNQ